MSEAKEIGKSLASKSKAPKKKVIIAATILVGIIVVAALIYLFLFSNSPLGNSGIAGVYDSTDPDHTGSYIELRSDGTAFLFSAYTGNPGLSSGVDGNWELRDQNRIYVTTAQGMAGYLTIGDNKLTYEGTGETYVKRGSTQGDGVTDGETKKEIEWERKWGLDYDDTAFSVVQTVDGGYAIAGYSHTYYEDYWLVKTDANGNRQWDRTYGGQWDDDAYCMARTSDGGYVLAGISVSYSADQGGGSTYPYGSFWLVKTDVNGSTTWSNGYGGKNSGAAYSVIQAGDGGYVMAGEGFANLVKTNGNGVLQWSKSYGGTARCVVQTSDGGYAMAGSSMGNGGDFWLVKTDANGNAQWTKTFGGANNDCAYSVVQTNDGGYAMAGVTSSYGTKGSGFWLVKTDVNGNRLWNKTYGGEGDDTAYSLVKTSDGGYAIAGKASNGQGNEASIVKTDADGNLQWNMTYGEAGYATSIIQTADGGYVFAGRTQTTGSGNYEFWLVKIEA